MSKEEIGLPVSFPEAQVASLCTMTVSVAEFLIAMGHRRVGYFADGSAGPSTMEFRSAYSMSLNAAKNMAEMLALGVKHYEEKYGPIPQETLVDEKPPISEIKSSIQEDKIIPAKPAAPRKVPAKKR